MKVSYRLGWMKRGRTPSVFRAMVYEAGNANWVERLIGRNSYRRSDEYIGHSIWFREGTKIRAVKALEKFLEDKTRYADMKHGGGKKCALPYGMITFRQR